MEEILGITNPIDHTDSNPNPKADTDPHTNTFASKTVLSPEELINGLKRQQNGQLYKTPQTKPTSLTSNQT